MPTSVLDIEINDEQFKAYLERFNAYREAVGELPGLWGQQADVVGAIGAGFAAMTAALIEQNAEIAKQLKAEKELEKQRSEAAKAQRQEQRDQAERDKQAAARRRAAVEDVKKMSSAVADTVTNVAKWTFMGGGAALLGGALSFWGLDKFVEGIGQERRLASGFGVSTGERQALGVNFQRYFDVNGVLENISNAQMDPTKWWLFSTMGVNPAGKDPAQLSTEMALRARQMFIQDRGNLAMAQAQGLTQIFSPDELRRLAHTSEAELRAGESGYRRDVGKFALSDDVNRKWQDFIVRLDEAGLTLKNALVDKLTLLEPDLEVLIRKFTDLAVTVLDRIDFKVLGDGLDTFTKYIGNDQFQKDFGVFITDVGLVAQKLVDVLAWLGVIPKPGGVAPGPAPPGVPTPTVPLPRGPGGSASVAFGIIGGGKPGTELWTAEVMQPVGRQLEKWGWTDPQARGILANLRLESGLDPFAQGDFNQRTHRYDAYGIAQWHADRQAIYAKLFGHTMQAVKDPQQALTEQLEFVQYELTRGNFKKAGDDLRRITGAFSAGAEVTREYERPKDRIFAPIVRGAAAMSITIKNQAGGSVAVSTNAAAAGG